MIEQTKRPSGGGRLAARRRPARRGRLEVGTVLGTGFTIWIGNLPIFLALTALVFVPYLVGVGLLQRAVPGVSGEFWYVWVRTAIQLLLTWTLSALVIFGVFQRLQKRPVSFSRTLLVGLRRLPVVIGANLVLMTLLVALFAPGVAMLFVPGFDMVGGLLSIPATVVTMVLSCGFWVMVPACVVERKGVTASMARSWALTKGSKGWVFLIWIVLLVYTGVLGVLATLLLLAFTNLGDLWSEAVMAFFSSSLTAVVTAVGYHDLRRIVDGMDSGELAAIFD